MADEAEKIAFIIDTQAQLAGLRNTQSGLLDLSAAAKEANKSLDKMGPASIDAAGNVVLSAQRMQAAFFSARGNIAEYNNTLLAEKERALDAAKANQVLAQSITVQGIALEGATNSVNRFGGGARTTALAASRLTLAVDGLGGGITGVARSVGTLAYGLSTTEGSLAALAGPIAAAAIIFATLGDFMFKDAQRATELSDAFKNHLANLKFDATQEALAGVHKQIGDLEAEIPNFADKLKLLSSVGLGGFLDATGSRSDSFLTNLRRELTLTTAAEDEFGKKLNENTALGERNALQTQAMADAVTALNTAYTINVRTSGARAQELQDQIAGNTFASQRVSLIEAERVQVDEINKKYADYAKTNKALTADQIVQQQVEVANAQRQLDLELRLNDVEKSKADAAKAAAVAQATLRVQAAGAGATSDIDGPSATLNKQLLDIDREYSQAVDKEHVDRNVAAAARDAERLRAYRDFSNALVQEDARRAESSARIQETIDRANSDEVTAWQRMAAERAKADADAERQIVQNHGDSDQIEAARLARKARAYRDYLTEIEKEQRENDDAIRGSQTDIDPDAAEAQARLDIWRQYYDNLGKLSISFADQAARRDAALSRLDRDVFVASIQHLQASASAAEHYGGVVGAIAKATGDAIRRGELAVNAYKDFGKGKSEGAAALAALAEQNYVGAALHGAASIAYFGAAAFEAAGALGPSGDSSTGGGSGGGALNSSNSTFTPSDQNKSGGQVVNLYTVNPFSREVVSATAYYLDQQGVLKVPIQIPPTFGLTGRAA